MTVAYTKYVDPDASGNSSGWDVTNAYTSLTTAEAAEQANLNNINEVTVSVTVGFTSSDANESLAFSNSLATARLINFTGTTLIYEVQSGIPEVNDVITGVTGNVTLSSIDDSTGGSITFDCSSSGNTPDVVATFDTWTTTTTNNIIISGESLGIWDDTKYKMIADDNYAAILTIHQIGTKIEKLQVRNTALVSQNPQGITGSVNDIHIDKCIANLTGTGVPSDFCSAIYINGNTITRTRITNNIIYGNHNNGVYVYTNGASGNTISVCNNSIIGTDGVSLYGIRDRQFMNAGVDYNVLNNICQNHTTADYSISGTITSAGNISEDTSSPDVAFRSIVLTFNDASGGDYHLAATDTDAIGAGIGINLNSEVPPDDIDGDIRSGDTTDIGADLYISGAVLNVDNSLTIGFKGNPVFDNGINTEYSGNYNIDKSINVEHINGLNIDKIIPAELKQSITIDYVHTTDYLGIISKLNSIFVDYRIIFTDLIGEPTITIDPSANVITINMISAINYSGSFSANSISNIEYYNQLTISKPTSIEYSIEVGETSTYSIDYFNNVDVNNYINISSLGSLYINNTINIENTGELIVGSANTIPIEYFNFLNNDNIINISHSSLLDKNTDTSIEYIHSVSQDYTTLEEYIHSVYADKTTSIESKQTISIDNIHPINHFAIISKLTDLLVDYKVIFTDIVGTPTITIDPSINTITANMITAVDHNAAIENNSASTIEFTGSFAIDQIIPVGHGNEVDIDITRIFNVEHVGIPSFDRVMNSEYVNTLFTDYDLPASFNYLRTKDCIVSVSNEQQTLKDNDIGIGISSIVINDEVIVLEYNSTIQKTSLTNIEYILELSNTNILNVAYIHSINTDKSIEIEHLGLYIITFDQIIPVEYKYNIGTLNTLNVSHLHSVYRSDVIFVDYSGSLIVSRQTLTSYNAGIRSNRIISIDYNASITNAITTPIENQHILDFNRVTPIDYFHSIGINKSITSGFSHVLNNDGVIDLDYNASITNAITTPIENRYILDFNRVTPIDYFHSIGINKSITSGFSHVLNNDALLNVNWIQFIEQHSIIPVSFLHALEQSTVTNIEHQKSIALDQNVNIEFYNKLNIDKTVTIEELSVIFSDEYDLPVDWREQIISDDIAVIEYDSYVILVPITDAANIWNLETRKTSWEINNTITLDDNDVWNLEARKYTWIIQKK